MADYMIRITTEKCLLQIQIVIIRGTSSGLILLFYIHSNYDVGEAFATQGIKTTPHLFNF